MFDRFLSLPMKKFAAETITCCLFEKCFNRVIGALPSRIISFLICSSVLCCIFMGSNVRDLHASGGSTYTKFVSGHCYSTY